ncbi:beta-ketoacyl-[acyl-carrier-protein] synthase family protein [Streptomyces sp. NPDC019443]|uniref:beta-ketoacyl-[acyl-carrier-protein] synthase family protein n=1 Tax=Streptomyces sp. NPDC019443 TaxID=3365061 RepID=UPI0037A8B3A3
MRRVVVTGLGIVSPAGIGKEAFWEKIATGTSATRPLAELASSHLFGELGELSFVSDSIAEVLDFEERARTLPAEVRRLDRYIQFGVAGALDALADAGLRADGGAAGDRTGVAFATAVCGTRLMEEEYLNVTDRGRSEIDPSGAARDLYLASMSNTPALVLSAMLGAQGPCVTLSTGCVGGIDAIGYAFEAVKYGDADIMISGATEAPISPVTIGAFEIIHCLSQRHADRPHAASRPYDAQRDGFVLGEGCGMVVLEELEHARRRGAHIYMEIAGFSNTANAVHMTDLLTDGADLARAMTDCLEQAGLEPTDVDYVNSHGSSTPQNDACETSALKLALGEHAYRIPVNSTKSMLGHALSAASAMEIVMCALSLERSFVHPTINYEHPDPACDLDYVPNEGRPWNGDVIVSDASGFSGLHTALLLRALPASATPATGKEAVA